MAYQLFLGYLMPKTFLGYLKPKPYLLEEQYHLTHSWEDNGVHTFPICPKVNVIAWLEYELAYHDSAVHRFNHYTTRTPHSNVRKCYYQKSSNGELYLAKNEVVVVREVKLTASCILYIPVSSRFQNIRIIFHLVDFLVFRKPFFIVVVFVGFFFYLLLFINYFCNIFSIILIISVIFS